ncbi:MAG: TetR/AcrR family transcriptional regulator [Burkholderiales bacterium]|nr:TetR/AcrR family transcriptional regulator [Burkholderiales bacterium]
METLLPGRSATIGGMAARKPLQGRARIGEIKREKTRAALIQVALQVISDRGFDAPTIDDFIEAAQVARGTFYNYFRSRDELLIAAAAHVADSVDQEILPLFAVADDPAQRVAIAIRKFIEMSMRHPHQGGLLVRMIPLSGGAVSDEMRRGVLEDLENGRKLGRFHWRSLQAALALSMGTITLAIRTAISEPTPANFSELIAAMVLQGLGMPAKEAQRVAALPLPRPSA